MKTILFQGDSITDAGRSRTDDFHQGCGYPTIVSGRLGRDNPNQYKFLNRGISGNRVVDLYSRWREDCLLLKPDYLSILIGVNDVWHEVDNGRGVPTERFLKVYRLLIEETMEHLPDTKIMILEPYVLHGTATDGKYDEFIRDVSEKQAVALQVANEYKLPFVPLQDKLNKALYQADASCWLIDGVHPTAMGHTLIADAWIEEFNKIK